MSKPKQHLMIGRHNMRILQLSLLALSILITMTSHAQSEDEQPKKMEGTVYSPEYCSFSAQFPEEPFIGKKCETEAEESCYNLISYTKVFEALSASINFEIICNPSTPEFFTQFTEDVMKRTVKEMTKDAVVESYEVMTREDVNYRQASLVGQGKKGLYDTIYIVQIWLTEGSIMSVQAEMSGEQSEEADELFAKILGSIGYADKSGDAKAKEPPKNSGQSVSEPSQP